MFWNQLVPVGLLFHISVLWLGSNTLHKYFASGAKEYAYLVGEVKIRGCNFDDNC